MARQRRGGGFKPPEIKGTLGTLLRSTLQQASAGAEVMRGVAKDMLERGAREGRQRFEDVRREFEQRSTSTRGGGRGRDRGEDREELLAELGAIVLELIRAKEIDPRELPEVRDVVAQLDALDDDDGYEDDGDEDEELEEAPPPPRRGGGRAPAPAALPLRDRGRDRGDRDDGTVSASHARSWQAAPPRPAPRVWRPVNEPPAPAEEEPTRPPPFRAGTNPPATRKGGISFDHGDDDSDLADYMHPDDVPAKPSKPGNDA